MAHERDEDNKDVKAGTMIKDKNGKLVTDRNEVLHVWEEYLTDFDEVRIKMLAVA